MLVPLLQLQKQSHDERDEKLNMSTPLVIAKDPIFAGHFKATSSSIEQLVDDFKVDAIELVDRLNPQQVNCVVRACGVLYLAA